MKVGMLILMAHDLDKVVEFYKNVGFDLKFHLKDRWAEFAVGNIKIGVCPTEHEPFDRSTGIVFEVADLAKAFADLKAKGVEFMGEPKEAVHGIMVGFKDPSGNISDLYQPTPEKVQEVVKQQQETAAKEGKSSCCASESKCKPGEACSGCKDGGSCGDDKECN
jgi:predicted enzyme related to lactoylglutathione lyase